jgi:ADP-heptose:LPS heptosyltransferase/predicted SAM-dependent methyltransferase
MVWKIDDPQGNESAKIRWELVPYTRGRGIDLGCGPYVTFPHFIRVDNCVDEQLFGRSAHPDIRIQTAENLDLFASASMDFVFSSHLLEHIPPENVSKTLKEWLRIIKRDGHLVMYLPADDLYPKVGEHGANPDHKWDVSFDSLMGYMKQAGDWDLIDYQHRSEGQEYSHFFVFKKIKSGQYQSWSKAKKPAKSVGVVRYGAWGDLLQASSVFKGLKDQGYHVTVYASPPGSDIITLDPNIDQIILQDKDQVPNQNLGDFWAYIAKKYDKFVNLSESVENSLLSTPGRIQHVWPPAVRHSYFNRNYLELQHDIAGIPHKPQIKFFASVEEREFARKERAKMGAFTILWCLAGSSVHKTWPYLDQMIAGLMLDFKDVHVVLVGNEAGKLLEQGWEKEPRVHRRSGIWSIRQTLAFVDEADMLIGPETGVMNAAACKSIPKVLFLSHSTHENLTRDWVNTHALISENTTCNGRGENAAPACHMLHYNWDFCKKTENGVAQCQEDIKPDTTYKVIWHTIQQAREAAA